MREVGYRVTLDLVVDRDEHDNPAGWDWPTLLEVLPSKILTPPTAEVIELPKAQVLKLVKGTDVSDNDRTSSEPAS